MVRAGSMRHVVRIEARSTLQDAAGETIDSWTLVAERRASIDRTPGAEVWSSAHREGRVPTVFRVRYLDGVMPAMRLVHGGKVYDIASAVDQSGLKEELVITTEELEGAVLNPLPETMQVTAEFTTADPVESTFPIFVPLTSGAAAGVDVIRAQNLTTPAALFYESVFVDWEPAVGGFNIRYVSGLDAATSYQLTLEVRNA